MTIEDEVRNQTAKSTALVHISSSDYTQSLKLLRRCTNYLLLQLLFYRTIQVYLHVSTIAAPAVEIMQFQRRSAKSSFVYFAVTAGSIVLTGAAVSGLFLPRA